MNFTNPILTGSYPDPSICRCKDDYYLVTSSFEYFPGVPIFHSKDLVNWKQIGHVLDRESQISLKKMRSSGGIYAPTIRFNNGIFYMITTLVNGGGNFYVTTTDPFGPWSDPIWIGTDGIDPSLFFDDDGVVYYHQQFGGRHGQISQSIIDIKTGKLTNDLTPIWSGTGGVWPEGPHLFKRNNIYYLIIAEGGTSYDHKITIAKSNSPMGPFIPHPDNPILTHSNLPDHPFQAMGHCDFIETDNGWWSVLLGIRQSNNHMGRETFLTPIEWDENDWPIINNNKPISKITDFPNLIESPPKNKSYYYEFKNNLGLEWNYLRNPKLENYSLTDYLENLTLYGDKETLSDQDTSTFIGQRQTAANCNISTCLSFDSTNKNEEAVLAIRANDINHLFIGIHRDNNSNIVFFKETLEGELTEHVNITIENFNNIILIIEAKPDYYHFYFKENINSEKIFLGKSLTKHFVYEKIGNFMGVYWGLYSTGNGEKCSNPALFNWLKYDIIEF